MRVAAFVFWDLGVEYLRILIEEGLEVVAVVTPPTEVGVAAPPGYSVEAFANNAFLPVYKPPLNRVNSPEFVRVLDRLQPDLLLGCYFPKILSRAILAIPRLGCLNTHPSMLPKDRGMFPVFMPVVRRDSTAGITIYHLDPGVDTGDIVIQRAFTLDERETGRSITEKLRMTAAGMLREILPLLRAGKLPRVPQNHAESTQFSWRPEQHARIDWRRTTGEIDALVRALGGLYGGAHSSLGRRKVLLHALSPAASHLAKAATSAVPGQVIARSGAGYLVRTGDGVVEVSNMAFEDGAQPTIDDVLASSHLPVVFS